MYGMSSPLKRKTKEKVDVHCLYSVSLNIDSGELVMMKKCLKYLALLSTNLFPFSRSEFL